MSAELVVLRHQDQNDYRRDRKREWQQRLRADFRERTGYSLSAHYATGGLREDVLRRDNFACVRCGMSDADHKAKWGRPITIDHRDKDRSNNTMENLQTLCLECHGRKDLIPRLRRRRVPALKSQIITRRENGDTYQKIADDLGLSIGSVWKWCKRWDGGAE